MNGFEMSLCSLDIVLKACSAPEWTPSSDEVRLSVVKGSVRFDVLRDLENSDVFAANIAHQGEPDLQTLYDNGASGELREGTAFSLRLPRVVDRWVVAKNLEDLLALHSATWQEPKAYFLITEEESNNPFCFEGEESLQTAPKLVRRYHEALKLWACIRGQAEHIADTESLMFFGIRRIEIVPRFEARDLKEDISLKEISDFINNRDRKETRAEIFRSVLSEFLRDRQPERAFAYVLRSSTLFARRLVEGLAIYLSANSPEKLTEEATAKHFELAEKLEKVITGMEAKSLSIPAAVLLAIKEVHFGERWVALNVIILGSAVLYLAAMTVAHFSQRAMLKLLQDTINKAVEDLRNQGLDDANPVLAKSFKSLKTRRANSALGSWVMWFFSIVPLIAVLYAALFASPSPKPNTAGPTVQNSNVSAAKARREARSPASRPTRLREFSVAGECFKTGGLVETIPTSIYGAVRSIGKSL
jgi:hypothetical protein